MFKKNVINFGKLDTLLDTIHLNNLRPVFELMGNPGGLFRDFKTEFETKLWFRIVTNLVQRYTKR